MRQRDKAKMDPVRQWLERAEKDFNLARHLAAERHSYLEAIAFHSHQTAEKLLKGFLVFHQVDFPKTHNLGELLDLVATRDPALAVELADITALNPYGVEYRYRSMMRTR
jgi:HEPN domain-containing protein